MQPGFTVLSPERDELVADDSGGHIGWTQLTLPDDFVSTVAAQAANVTALAATMELNSANLASQYRSKLSDLTRILAENMNGNSIHP